MEWKLDSTRPIYSQIIEKVELDIIAGRYRPGQQLPSVRDLALTAGVNPNTMQRALSELERSGLLESRRTSGRFITEDTGMITEIRNSLAEEQIADFLEKMRELGITGEELINRLTAEARKQVSANEKMPAAEGV